jgi:GNAT superfamily N-acetyltransferase
MSGTDGEVVIAEVGGESPSLAQVVALAHEVLAQDGALTAAFPHAERSIVLGAFVDGSCVGFLRCLVQVIGSDVGRPPIVVDAEPLREGYVEAFGVAPARRRRGIGSALQDRARDLCRAHGCYQVRSRSPVTSTENYRLKLTTGYVVHPSERNDSYYFVLRL